MFTDRSRIMAFKECPRRRFLNYHHIGIGIAKQSLSIPLASGTYVHLGLAALLLGAGADEAVGLATEAYWEAAHTALGAMKVTKDHYLYTMEEQNALVEALIRVYALRGLPALKAKYDIIGVETEYEFELAPDVTFMARLDGELLNRETGEVEVLSFKTDTGYDLTRKIEDARIDYQGLTEPEAYFQAHGIQPIGVKMEWLVKGSRQEEPKGSGLRYQNTHLIRPWMRDDIVGREFAWAYYYPCPGVEHTQTSAAGRNYKCKGSDGKHKLNEAWGRVNIWEHMKVKEWIDTLASNSIQSSAGDPLDGVLYLPEPIYRTQADQERAMRQIHYQEKGINLASKIIEDCSSKEKKVELLDRYFPMHQGHPCNNTFGDDCPVKVLCYGADQSYLTSGEMPPGYVPRTPHHSPELISIKGANNAS